MFTCTSHRGIFQPIRWLPKQAFFFFFFIRCHAYRNPSLIFSIDFLPPFLSRLFSLLFSVLFFHLSFVCFFYFNSKIGTLVVIVWPRSYFSFLFCPLFFFSSPPFSLFIDRVALMPHSSPIGVKYGLAIGT